MNWVTFFHDLTWIDYLLLAGFVLGMFAGGVMVARSPKFWVGVGIVILKKLWPYIVKAFLATAAYIGKPMSPEDTEKWHQSIRRAQEWDPFNKRPRDK